VIESFVTFTVIYASWRLTGFVLEKYFPRLIERIAKAVMR